MADKVLNYTTNMSKITSQDKVKGERDLFDLWEHFPNIEMWASIDAIGKAGDMILKDLDGNVLRKIC